MKTNNFQEKTNKILNKLNEQTDWWKSKIVISLWLSYLLLQILYKTIFASSLVIYKLSIVYNYIILLFILTIVIYFVLSFILSILNK